MEADETRTKMKKAEHLPHPPPQVTARIATDEETPKVAAATRKIAQLAGWQVATTYARGCPIDGHGNPGALCHSIALRMSRGAQYAVMVWTCPVEGEVKWSLQVSSALARWHCAASGLSGLTPCKMKSAELKAFLKAAPPADGPTVEALDALALLAA